MVMYAYIFHTQFLAGNIWRTSVGIVNPKDVIENNISATGFTMDTARRRMKKNN